MEFDELMDGYGCASSDAVACRLVHERVFDTIANMPARMSMLARSGEFSKILYVLMLIWGDRWRKGLKSWKKMVMAPVTYVHEEKLGWHAYHPMKLMSYPCPGDRLPLLFDMGNRDKLIAKQPAVFQVLHAAHMIMNETWRVDIKDPHFYVKRKMMWCPDEENPYQKDHPLVKLKLVVRDGPDRDFFEWTTVSSRRSATRLKLFACVTFVSVEPLLHRMIRNWRLYKTPKITFSYK